MSYRSASEGLRPTSDSPLHLAVLSAIDPAHGRCTLHAHLLATEHEASLFEGARRICLQMCEATRASSLDLDNVPWELIALRLKCPRNYESHPYVRLSKLLCNGRSDIRLWALEVAWLCRDLLPTYLTVESLSFNISSALMGVDLSLALSFAICKDKEHWVQLLDRFRSLQPVHFLEQYDERRKIMQEAEFRIGLMSIHELETNCRQRIFEAGSRICSRHIPQHSQALHQRSGDSPSEIHP